MNRRQLMQGAAALAVPCTVVAGADALPQLAAGRLERLVLEDATLGPRPVDVWLPPSYRADRPHAVLYMHDGQMLFDPRSTWNRQAWTVDAVAAPLIADGTLRDFIVVGLHNHAEQRHAEFFPQACWPAIEKTAPGQRYLAGQLKRLPLSDAYLRSLVHELKPRIDTRYATDPRPASTFLMGSSMGGLISLYGLCEYPQVFGGAAALSTHWIGLYERNAEIPGALLSYLERKLPAPGSHRLYLDRGTAGLDALYDEAQARVDALLAARGHRPPLTQTRVFEDADHTEQHWAARLALPLRALLARPDDAAA